MHVFSFARAISIFCANAKSQAHFARKLNAKESLCVRKSYRYRLANGNAVLFCRFVHALSPTFLIRLQWAQIHLLLCNIVRCTLPFTHLPLLMLMWPIRFVSIWHWSLLVFVLPYRIWYTNCLGLRPPKLLALAALAAAAATCWDLLYMDMNLFAWYSIMPFCSLSQPFILDLPTLFCLCRCATATNAYDKQLWWQMNGVLL